MTVAQLTTADLARLFRRYCPGRNSGLHKSEPRKIIEAEKILEESDDPARLARDSLDPFFKIETGLRDS